MLRSFLGLLWHAANSEPCRDRRMATSAADVQHGTWPIVVTSQQTKQLLRASCWLSLARRTSASNREPVVDLLCSIKRDFNQITNDHQLFVTHWKPSCATHRFVLVSDSSKLIDFVNFIRWRSAIERTPFSV